MTDMKQNKETMSAQELQKVEGGFVTPGKLPIFHPGKLPIVLGKRNDEGMRSNGASVSTIVADAKPLVLGYGI